MQAATQDEPTEMFLDTQDVQWLDDMLQGTSRTFALTIPQLPAPLSHAVSTAYLLCRTIDTIEDEPALVLSDKEKFAHQFVESMQGKFSPNSLAQTLAPCLSGSTLAAEKTLIKGLPTLLRIYHTFPESYEKPMLRCVRIMAGGMIRTQQEMPEHGLNTLKDLNRYCYYVAGVVGEMLSALYVAYNSDVPDDALFYQQAVSFGQGLQMTNILKDIHADRARGVCWLPKDVFAKHGYDLRELGSAANPEAFSASMHELIGVAHAHLRHALDYTLRIPASETGIRNFCLWALGMALLTLKKIARNPCYQSADEVKISRRSVKLTAALCSINADKDRRLKGLFAAAAHKLPLSPVTLPVPR